MKKLSYILLSIILAFGVAACQKENVPEQQPAETSEQGKVIYARLLNESDSGTDAKTHLESDVTGKYKVVWDSGDKITVVGTNGTAVYRLIEGAGEQEGVFAFVSGVKELEGPYTAYSPFSMCDNTSKATWPTIQTYISEGMIAGAPMRAVTETLDETLKFRNVGGIIRFTVKRSDEGATAKNIKSVVVTTADKDAYVLSCKTAIEIPSGDNGMSFYIALPAGTYPALHFEFITDSNSRLSLTTKKDIVVARSEISTLTKTYKDTDWNKEEDLQWVNLGLPSGLLWANKNLGASSVTDSGDYYFWGETSPWFICSTEDNTITWRSEAYESMAGNEANWTSGSNMKKVKSDLEGYFKKYDAALVRSGDGFMPSLEDWNELISNTTPEIVTIDKVNCLKLTSKITGYKDKFICLPLAGKYNWDANDHRAELSSVNETANYMSRTVFDGDNSSYHYMFSNRWPAASTDNFRVLYSVKWKVAMPVRAVKAPEDVQMEFVDLGLSVLWADMNLGAKSKKGRLSYGTYFMWGYTEDEYFDGFGYEFYNKWGENWQSGFGGKYNEKDKLITLEDMDDVAYVASNGEYRMPSYAELEELIENTKQTVFEAISPEYGSIHGVLLTSKIEGFTSESIFVPAAGYYHQSGQYTHITAKENQPEPYTGQAHGTVKEAKNGWVGGELELTEKGLTGTSRYTGLPVRPVKDKK